MNYSHEYTDLIGETIVSAKKDLLGDWLEFTMKSGKVIRLTTYGDCCSQTWIEGIDLPAMLYGKIMAVEDIDMPDLGTVQTPLCSYPECVQYYGLKITTTKGSCVIDYRNNSNGYYGGDIHVHVLKEKEDVGSE